MSQSLVSPLAGVTIASPDPGALAQLLAEGCGWSLVSSGVIDAELEAVWGVDGGSAGRAFSILGSPGGSVGLVRLVEGGERIKQRQIGARYSGVEIVVSEGLDALAERLRRYPFWRHGKGPFDADFEAEGSNIHRAFFGYLPGGTHIMFTMAVTETGDVDFPETGAHVGHIFDVHLVAKDFQASKTLYHAVLGMDPILSTHMTGGLWHTVWDLEDGHPVNLDILTGASPKGVLGGVELQGYRDDVIDLAEAVEGRLDGGACIATFPATDIDAAYAAVRDSGLARMITEPRAIAAEPYGGTRAFCCIGPAGERLEICERAWGPA